MFKRSSAVALRTQTHHCAGREKPLTEGEGKAQPFRNVTRWAPPTLTLRRASTDNVAVYTVQCWH